MKILLIEDTKQLADSLKIGLETSGFVVDVAYTGNQGEMLACVNDYDVILLDLNLPDKDGLDILRYLRDELIESPVIIISARDEIEQRALGLDLGADDYVIKPFDLLELRARIHAVIRRFHGRVNPVISIGRLQVNPLSRQVLIDEKEVHLSAKEFDVLEYIAMQYPNVVSSEQIAEHIYDDMYDPFSSVLRVHLARLRKKLADCAKTEMLINIRGKGYKLCVD
ncbi:DNA-binding response OmpR family regulator [Breznakia blatticola]|uniref:DNA-binding response OmpR family regulator n=1 Tax=Breznakia blatticola TaxID=1754012 RepID=A0A4R8A6E2_9FIRM|nr:response regulator transcription factor [Breznakia blatticola]TDW25985.1 DNA-binding response OmpR family regulator [Breznakia blatticola]